MKEAELIKLCEDIIVTYNPLKVTPTTHADEFLEQKRVTDENDATFIRQVFYGVDRYRKLISLTMESLYHINSGRVLRSDITLYSVMVYLAVLRLEELSVPVFRGFVNAHDPVKMLPLLSFLWDETNMQTILKEQW